mmetsp:Transcript_10298/g.22952  ORF Transcript_10298/g.22952 Transcript_10298/m.22952 type:complete len:261 (+) Transcript_10298:376-1158(+)
MQICCANLQPKAAGGTEQRADRSCALRPSEHHRPSRREVRVHEDHTRSPSAPQHSARVHQLRARLLQLLQHHAEGRPLRRLLPSAGHEAEQRDWRAFRRRQPHAVESHPARHLAAVHPVEGDLGGEQLPHHDAEAPHVRLGGVLLASQHLGGDPLQRPHACVGEGVEQFSGEAKVRDPDGEVGGEQQVGRLEVAVDHARRARVEVVHAACHVLEHAQRDLKRGRAAAAAAAEPHVHRALGKVLSHHHQLAMCADADANER